MAFLADLKELKPGLVIFRRTDVRHKNWYCRVSLPNADQTRNAGRYKTVALKTSDLETATSRAYDQDADVRFRVKHEVPLFNRPFSAIAKDFEEFQKARYLAGEISKHRWRVMESHIRAQLNRYVGPMQINLVNGERWKSYPIWRQANGTGRSGGPVSSGTIRDEMQTFRGVMSFAAAKGYIRESHVPKGKLPIAKERREEFTPQEYRKLHTFARSWIKDARNTQYDWYRNVAYNFVLIMCNTGMRPSEAKNLKWRDIQPKTHRDGQKFVVLNVRGKDKFRSLVAAQSVGNYLDRIREIAKATNPDDAVFTNYKGEPTKTLYYDLIETLLEDSALLLSSTGKRRSIYCFRHTYATFRLTEEVDVYFLAKQMGTSVAMIEKHYGHINPVKNAERILMGLPGWTPASPADGAIEFELANSPLESHDKKKGTRRQEKNDCTISPEPDSTDVEQSPSSSQPSTNIPGDAARVAFQGAFPYDCYAPSSRFELCNGGAVALESPLELLEPEISI